MPGAPRGVSYASEIAEQHGISYAQLVALFRDRGLLAAAEFGARVHPTTHSTPALPG